MVLSRNRRQKATAGTPLISKASQAPIPAAVPRVVPSATAARKAAASQAKKAAAGAGAGCASSMLVGGLDGLHSSGDAGVEPAATLECW